MQPSQLALGVGAVSGFLTVALGAFGAHGLSSFLTDEAMTIYKTGNGYQAFHSLALLVCGIMTKNTSSKSMNVAIWAFILGILLFSGSLYLLALNGPRWLGAITPLGGTAFLIGWTSMLISVKRLPG